jgi:hypothetical protein
VAARLGAARQLAQQLVLNLQYVWGKSSDAVQYSAHLETAIDQIRSALDTCYSAEGHADPHTPAAFPYYPAYLWLPEAINTAICSTFCEPYTPRSRRPRLTPAQGDALIERLAVHRHLLDTITFLVLEGYGASHPISERCQRLWRSGGQLSRLGLAIERQWMQHDRPFWPMEAQNTFLRRLDTLPQAVPIPDVWQAWFDILDAPDFVVDGT